MALEKFLTDIYKVNTVLSPLFQCVDFNFFYIDTGYGI